MPSRRKASNEAASRPECRHCGVRHRSITEDQCQDRSMSEKTLQSRIVGRAKARGWVVRHVGKGIAAFTKSGEPIYVSTAKSFPDLFLLHPVWARVLTIECKKQQGEFEEGQLEYLQLLNLCGIPSVVCRPSDLREGNVNAILGKQ